MIRIEETDKTLLIIDNDITEDTIPKIQKIVLLTGKNILVDFELIHFEGISNDYLNQYNVEKLLRSNYENTLGDLYNIIRDALKDKSNDLSEAVQLKALFSK